MERVTFKEYEAAKAAVLYGKEFEENSKMENSVIHKQYACKDGSGTFYERTENGVTEFWSTEHSESRIYADKVEEKEEFSESRKKAIQRLHKLAYWFADEMLNQEDEGKRTEEEFKRQCKEKPEEQIFMVSASENNVRVMKDCLRSARDAAEFLKKCDSDIEEWQLAGINAMFDKCNEESIVPYDLPEVVKGLLCMHILRKED